ncbi:hypothetical protein ACQKP7_14745 [Pseudomonas frederiksbergensis]|uniref:hypothetical protein n=1 Tax=Pseudomonas frederiksbergensis TaxID=104087 RepID=UPI003D076D5D
MSGEGRGGVRRFASVFDFVGARLAREGVLTTDQSAPDVLDQIVGAAEGCDLLTLIFKIKIKRSQPSATPTTLFNR